MFVSRVFQRNNLLIRIRSLSRIDRIHLILQDTVSATLHFKGFTAVLASIDALGRWLCNSRDAPSGFDHPWTESGEARIPNPSLNR